MWLPQLLSSLRSTLFSRCDSLVCRLAYNEHTQRDTETNIVQTSVALFVCMCMCAIAVVFWCVDWLRERVVRWCMGSVAVRLYVCVRTNVEVQRVQNVKHSLYTNGVCTKITHIQTVSVQHGKAKQRRNSTNLSPMRSCSCILGSLTSLALV